MAISKKPRAPKMKKYPKRPKQSASLQSWENFETKCKAIDKENRDKNTVWHKAVSAFESAKNRKAAIIKKTSNLSGVKVSKARSKKR